MIETKEYIELKELGFSLSKFAVGAEGNISSRSKDGFFIKASGKSLKNITIDSLVQCSYSGVAMPNQSNRPSIETSFHAMLFNKNKDINYIAHTHPTNCLKILCSTKGVIHFFANNRIFPDQVVFNGAKSCVVPYAMPGEKLKNAMEKSVDEFTLFNGFFPEVILLENHGIICCGKTHGECMIKTEICEKSAEILLGCDAVSFLSRTQVDEILSDKTEKYRKNIA